MDKKELEQIIDKAEKLNICHSYVDCTIQFVDDRNTCDVTIKLSCGSGTDADDDDIFYFCNGYEDIRALCEEGTGEDFVIIGISEFY